MTAGLDEAVNVCRISDLPDLYGQPGSRGTNVVTLSRSYRQGGRVWGEGPGMDAMWSPATVALLRTGLDDADFVDEVCKLVGRHDVGTVSVLRSKEGTSRSVSYRLGPILPPDRVRALPKGTAPLLATGTRPALIRLPPRYKKPGTAVVSAAAAEEAEAITIRAAQKWVGHGVEH